jgi:hypothetical protein
MDALDSLGPASTAPTARRPRPRDAAFAWAAGSAGALANLLLVAFYLLLAVGSGAQDVVGSSNDLVGSLAMALSIPVALALVPLLPRRRAVRIAQAVGIAAMVVLTVGGPLLVLGILPFEVQTPIAIGASILLAAWLFLVNRWMRRAGTLDARITRVGQVIGAATLASLAGVLTGLLLLPWASVPQIAVLAIAGLPGVVAWLATPVWFLMLGGRLAALAAARRSPAHDTRPEEKP